MADTAVMTIRPLLLAAAGLTVVGCSAMPSSHTGTPDGWVTTALTQYGQPAEVAHPAAWRFMANQNPGQGPTWTVGYLTTEADHSGCITTHYRSNNTVGVVCHGPVTVLRPGGVLVRVDASAPGLGSTQFASNASVDGRSVQIEPGDLTTCPKGSTGSEHLRTQLRTPNASPPNAESAFSIQVCFNSTGTKENLAADADRVIRGIHFQ